MIPRLKELYYTKIQKDLQNKLSLKNKYMGPRLIKVVLNMGLGIEGNDQKILKSCRTNYNYLTTLSLISMNVPFKLVTRANVTESLLVTASLMVLIVRSFSFILSRDFSKFSAPF